MTPDEELKLRILAVKALDNLDAFKFDKELLLEYLNCLRPDRVLNLLDENARLTLRVAELEAKQ